MIIALLISMLQFNTKTVNSILLELLKMPIKNKVILILFALLQLLV